MLQIINHHEISFQGENTIYSYCSGCHLFNFQRLKTVDDFPVGNRIVDLEEVREGLQRCSSCKQGTRILIKFCINHFPLSLCILVRGCKHFSRQISKYTEDGFF